MWILLFRIWSFCFTIVIFKCILKKQIPKYKSNSLCSIMKLSVIIYLWLEMDGFRFESAKAKLEVSNGVFGFLHIWVSTPRVGPVTCKPALQTVYRGKTCGMRPFDVRKMSVVNNKNTLTRCNPHMIAAHTFTLSQSQFSVTSFNLSFANAKKTISYYTCIWWLLRCWVDYFFTFANTITPFWNANSVFAKHASKFDSSIL